MSKCVEISKKYSNALFLLHNMIKLWKTLQVLDYVNVTLAKKRLSVHVLIFLRLNVCSYKELALNTAFKCIIGARCFSSNISRDLSSFCRCSGGKVTGGSSFFPGFFPILFATFT